MKEVYRVIFQDEITRTVDCVYFEAMSHLHALARAKAWREHSPTHRYYVVKSLDRVTEAPNIKVHVLPKDGGL